jgi:hypothetical protein
MIAATATQRRPHLDAKSPKSGRAGVGRVLRMTTAGTDIRAAWRGADLVGRRDWVHQLTDGEIGELTDTVDAVRRAGLEVTTLRRDDVALPTLGPVIDGWADDLDAGRGFVLV